MNMKKKLKDKLKNMFKGSIREYLKENNLLNIHKNRVFKSKKKYSRKNRDWKDGSI